MHVEPFSAALSPRAAALRLCTLPGACWLDGEAPHADGARSYLAAEPVERIERALSDAEPLAALDAIERETLAHAAGPGPSELDLAQLPRWAGYIAYDATWSGRAQRLPRSPAARVLCFARYDAWLVLDHRQSRAFLAGDDRAACERLAARLSRAPEPRAPGARVGALHARAETEHLAAIARALVHIAAGDLYQVNLARTFRARFTGDPLALFLALRAASPVPFGLYLDAAPTFVAARSMERFLRWERAPGQLCTRPIKGTLARSGALDASEAAALRSDPKERAEHAMIVDLMRNDLGRVAVVGSVEVPEVMLAEPFAGLHHLVSTVRCRTRPELTLRALLEATFPPGSVTGTPKLAAIDCIERLEAEARGLYTGALGYVDQRGGLSLAVAIRTAVVEDGELSYGAGGGIVEASQPERELAETELKAKALRDAVSSL